MTANYETVWDSRTERGEIKAKTFLGLVSKIMKKASLSRDDINNIEGESRDFYVELRRNGPHINLRSSQNVGESEILRAMN